MELNQWSLKRWLLAGTQLVLILLILFGNWLGYDIYFSDGSATLLRVGKLMKNLADEFGSDGGSGLMAVAVWIYLLLIVGVFMTWQTVSNLFHSKTVSSGGYMFGVILFACMFLLVALTNSSLSSETDGLIDDVFKLESAAYWTLALGIAGWLICVKMPAPAASKPSSGGSVPHADAAPPQPALKHCLKCGRLEKNADSRFCSYCGGELAEELHCPKCHRLMDWSMRYCPTCGIDVYETEKTPDTPAPPAMPICRFCGTPAKKATATFCYKCGKPLTASLERKCPVCGEKLEEGDAFCPICGTSPDEKTAAHIPSSGTPAPAQGGLRQGGDL